jgi:hypothetical protein
MSEPRTGLSADELEQQSGEQLPDREAMSLIDPSLGGGIAPTDGWPSVDQPPHHQHPIEPQPAPPPIAE